MGAYLDKERTTSEENLNNLKVGLKLNTVDGRSRHQFQDLLGQSKIGSSSRNANTIYVNNASTDYKSKQSLEQRKWTNDQFTLYNTPLDISRDSQNETQTIPFFTHKSNDQDFRTSEINECKIQIISEEFQRHEEQAVSEFFNKKRFDPFAVIIKIQALVRKRLQRKKYVFTIKQIIKIQSQYRGYHQRKLKKSKLSKIVTIQKFYKQYQYKQKRCQLLTTLCINQTSRNQHKLYKAFTNMFLNSQNPASQQTKLLLDDHQKLNKQIDITNYKITDMQQLLNILREQNRQINIQTTKNQESIAQMQRQLEKEQLLTNEIKQSLNIQVIQQICTSSLNMHTLYETTEEEEEENEEQEVEVKESDSDFSHEMNADDFLNKHRKNKSCSFQNDSSEIEAIENKMIRPKTFSSSNNCQFETPRRRSLTNSNQISS